MSADFKLPFPLSFTDLENILVYLQDQIDYLFASQQYYAHGADDEGLVDSNQHDEANLHETTPTNASKDTTLSVNSTAPGSSENTSLPAASAPDTKEPVAQQYVESASNTSTGKESVPATDATSTNASEDTTLSVNTSAPAPPVTRTEEPTESITATTTSSTSVTQTAAANESNENEGDTENTRK